MPLGLLAKDSIQDLTSLAASTAETTTSHTNDSNDNNNHHDRHEHEDETETVPLDPRGTSMATTTTTAVEEEGQLIVSEAEEINNNHQYVDISSSASFPISGPETDSTTPPPTSTSQQQDQQQQQQEEETTSRRNDATQQAADSDRSEQLRHETTTGSNVDDDNNNRVATTANEHAANPQQAQEEQDDDAPPTTTGAYAGFRQDYYQRYHYGATQTGAMSTTTTTSTPQQQQQQHLHGDVHMDDSDSSYYYHDTYAPTVLRESASSQPFFPKLIFCLFPWMARPVEQEEEEATAEALFESQTYEQQVGPVTAAAAATTPTTSFDEGNNNHDNNDRSLKTVPRSDEDDECSSGSDALGEKLSDKERQAVLARLRLARPDDDKKSNHPGHNFAENDEQDGSSTSSSIAQRHAHRKGLLNGIPTYDTSPLEEQSDDKPLKGILKKRGSLTDLDGYNNSKNNSSTGSLGKPGGRKDEDSHKRRRSLFPSYLASARSGPRNHVRFAPMARVVTVKSKNDMLPDEKADIWWQKTDYEDFRKAGRIITKAMLEGGSEIWLTQTSSTPENAQSCDSVGASTGDKWWHKFGHSRRGLEHVVSVQEGRERQINVRTAIRAVLEEQARQKMYRREDAEKLRKVALNYTSWARDLALAAGHSDADAVTSEFSTERKSREFYLLKLARHQSTKNNVVLHHVPVFMQPAMHTHAVGGGMATVAAITTSPRITQPHLLDANTAAQISFRRRKVAPKPETQASPEEKESSEPIKDPKPEDHTQESLAHRAAGFSVEGEKVDMAAVLSGMGAIPQEKAHATTPVAS